MKLREEISSEGLERPEKEPVALSQRKTGGSPERSIERELSPQWGVATIEIAVSAPIEVADIPYYVRRTHPFCIVEESSMLKHG